MRAPARRAEKKRSSSGGGHRRRHLSPHLRHRQRVASAPPVFSAEPAPRPVTSRFRSRPRLPGMDLVGVSSPEPGPAAAWGPSKVSGGCGTRGMLVSEGKPWGPPRWSGLWLGLCLPSPFVACREQTAPHLARQPYPEKAGRKLL